MEIQYFISPHEHPLRLRENIINEEDRFIICQICNYNSARGAPFYVCDSCSGYYVHKSCAKLPNEIKHPFYPHYPLTLSPKRSTWCNSCYRYFKDAPFYSYGLNKFDMDVECALMPLATSSSEGRDWILHFGHPHPLLLLHVDENIKCFGCKSTSRGGDDNRALYGCSKCEYLLHKSCAELPLKIHHPLHDHDHKDALQLNVVRSFTCDNCHIKTGDRYNFRFSSDQRVLCFKCADAEPLTSVDIKCEHLLRPVENFKYTALFSSCNIGYDSYCRQHEVTSSDEFKHSKSSMLWCFYCNYRVHLLCASLPLVIKHKSHIHSLILVDSMREDDSDEYYCDVCETRRDPRIRLYCCQNCKYYAHVHCLIPEIVKILSGDLKDVVLKTVGQDYWNVPDHELKIDDVDQDLTLKDVLFKVPEREKNTLQCYYKWDETSSTDQKGMQDGRDNIENSNSFKVRDKEIDEILQLSRFTDARFRSFGTNLEDFYYADKMELKSSDLSLKIVKVQGYMIPLSLAPVLNKLLYKFGDIGNGPKYSLEFKSFVLFNVCKVVKRMHNTIPKSITKNLLQEWYYHLKFARRRGFQVDFACAQLKLLVHAFFGFQAERLEEEIPTILSKKIDDLQRKLDKCKDYRGSSPKPKYMEFCLDIASEFKLKINAFEDSLAQKWSTEDIQWTSGVGMW